MSSAWLHLGGKRKGEADGRRRGWWGAFRDWRRSRPFWAGVWTLLAGVEILSIPFAPLPVMMHEGIAGVAGSLMGIFMVVLALSLWLAPGYRVFAGIATLVFAVASLVLSNFGGFLIGFLLGITGGAMAVSWVPYERPPVRPRIWPDWGRGSGSGGSDGPEGPGGSGGSGGPGGAGGPGDPGSSGEPGNGGGGAGGHAVGGGSVGGSSRTNGLTWRTSRLRALGVLPIGALLTGGLQPAAPAHLPRMVQSHADPPSVLGGAAVDKSPPHLAVCSLLDGLLAGAVSTGRGTGSRIPVGAEPGHSADAQHPPGSGTAAGSPRGLPASRGPLVPNPRTDTHDTHRPGHGPGSVKPAPAPTHSSGAGLLGSVGDLLGLHDSPGARDEHDKGPAAQHDRATPPPTRPADPPQRSEHGHAAGPGTPDEQPSRSAAAGNTPSLLRLDIPPLPADGRMDGPLSLLPLHIELGGHSGRDEHSPWCLPRPLISLRLGVDAAAYRVRTAAQPFRVVSPLMVLTGLTYHGITEVPTAYGPQEVLVFTASRVDIASLRQTAPLLAPGCGRNQPAPPAPPFQGLPGLRLPLLDMGIPGIGRVDPSAPGPWYPCQGTLETDAPFGTTVASGHPVVLLTKVLSGNLLGLLPVTFTPSMPPPLPPGLTLPIPIFFTNVTAYNQYLSADELDVPGIHQTASR